MRQQKKCLPLYKLITFLLCSGYSSIENYVGNFEGIILEATILFLFNKNSYKYNMQYRSFKGIRISEIGLGTWQLGSADWGVVNEDEAFEILNSPEVGKSEKSVSP